MRRILLVSGCALLGVVLAGYCVGRPKANFVSGRILKDGVPYIAASVGLPPGDKGLHLFFVRPGSVEPGIYANLNVKDGSFTIGSDQGLGAGTYRLALVKGALGRQDEFANLFGRANSPLLVEIPRGNSAKMEIDIGKKTVVVTSK